MKQLLLGVMLMLTWSLSAQDEKVTFSQKGGSYPSAFTLSLSCEQPEHQIRYTLNGNTPTAQSRLYTQPMTLSRELYSSSNIYKIQISPEEYFTCPDSVRKAIVIRAAVFDVQGNCVSDVATNSYFIHALDCNFNQLPVVSICADSMALFSYDTGIFVPGASWSSDDPEWSGNYNFSGNEWERLINVEYYTPENEGFNQLAGLRTHGGRQSRYGTQKGIKLYARAEYGEKNFKYKIFDELSNEKYKRLVLKPFSSPWTDAGVQDWLAGHVARQLDVDAVASRPVVLFINGEYWGIYFLQEKTDERYLENHYDVDPDDVVVIGDWSGTADNGDNGTFLNLFHWMESADMTQETDFAYAEEQIDMNDFIDYMIFELFSANRDWPANNMRCWQYEMSPWRWLLYDGDACFSDLEFDSYANATYVGEEQWPSSSNATLFFRKLIENDTFQQRFIHRVFELSQTCFSYPATSLYLDKIYNIIYTEIEQQSKRFGVPTSKQSWQNYMQQLSDFLKKRPEQFVQQTIDFFQLQNSLDKINIQCSPNPIYAGTEWRLKFHTEDFGIAQLHVFDIYGKCVFTSPIFYDKGDNMLTINPKLAIGTYLVRIGNSSIKVIVR
ncbi:MAG: CotH kinase family protein [Bacteroidales bacterium]|nr:CotH kinase family protein [Bacteroidales bacterium]